MKKYTVKVTDSNNTILFNDIVESRNSKILKSIYTERYMFNQCEVKVDIKRKIEPPKYQITIFDVIDGIIPEK